MTKLEQQTRAAMEVSISSQISSCLCSDPNYASRQTKSCEANQTSLIIVEKSSRKTTSCEASQTSSTEVEKTSADCLTSPEISTKIKHNFPPLLSIRRSISPDQAASEMCLQEFEIFSASKRHAQNLFNQPHYVANDAKNSKGLVLNYGSNALPETPKYQKMERDNLMNDQLNANSLLKTGYLEGSPVNYKKDKVVSAIKFKTLEDKIGSQLENNHFEGCSESSIQLKYICEDGGGNQPVVKTMFPCNTHLADRPTPMPKQDNFGILPHTNTNSALLGLESDITPASSNNFILISSIEDHKPKPNIFVRCPSITSNSIMSGSNLETKSSQGSNTEENAHTKIVDVNVSSLDSAKAASTNLYSALPVIDSSIEQKTYKTGATSEKRKSLSSSPNVSEVEFPDAKRVSAVQDGPRKRTNKLRKIIFMELQDDAELFYMSNGKKVLKGYKKENGILCCCCREVVSPSKFEAHAGFSSKRQPYRGIYTASGVSLNELTDSLSRKYIMKSVDRECGLRKEFVSCTKCSKSFNAGLLKSPRVPADSELLCLSCKHNTRPRRACTQRQLTYKLKRIMELPKDICCILCNDGAFELGNEFSPRSFIFCGQCEKLFHVGCLKDHGICDLKERPIPWYSWLCSPNCKDVLVYLKGLVNSSPHDIHSLSTNHTLKKLFEERSLSSQNEHEVKWHLLSGSNKTCDNEALFSKATMIFTEAFGPMIKDDNDLIPAMVKGGELSKQNFGGMHCAVLTIKSEVVSAGLLRVFGRDIAELPLVATEREFHGMGYFKTLLSVVEQLLITLKVKTLVLPVDEEACHFWINKFGFSRMTNERAKQYAEDHWIIRFKKKIMLEKSFPQF